MFVRSFVTFRRVSEIYVKFSVKISLSGYISITTHQKAFIFGLWVPLRVWFHAMSDGPRDYAPGWGWRSKSRTLLKCVFLQICFENNLCTYISRFSDFALYLEDHLMYIWDNGSVWPDVWPQNKSRSLWPIYHGSVIWPYILKIIWWMNMTVWDNGSVCPDV